jgi:hypothetical protein
MRRRSLLPVPPAAFRGEPPRFEPKPDTPRAHANRGAPPVRFSGRFWSGTGRIGPDRPARDDGVSGCCRRNRRRKTGADAELTPRWRPRLPAAQINNVRTSVGGLSPLSGVSRAAQELAERRGFEPLIRCYPYNGLANRRLQPLGHLSGARRQGNLGQISACDTMAGIEMRIGRAQTGQGLRRRAGPPATGCACPQTGTSPARTVSRFSCRKSARHG